ncbi:uncharacterized protein FOMMEDRAFT_28998 [Fomitiporia mediterranea MF3/22]|uniref:uncharacterized protein n=1 Tax=Fomitiporia mediterranea (strain MF3/22) TaxID=694068 RepID=UPI0004409483|nr:uncharacterized protein FOMMEDRAFT_28998 [Fomitiporia mediterranea MF3/22]EJD01842.1 hypothetical protein FOMMEDRAFT_28998 [Fomitiporia mediterranea MF3/22]
MPVAYISLWKTSESFHTSLHSKLNATYEALRPSFHSFVVFCDTMWPFVLPPLFAIALEAPLSLRTWIAVQKTLPPRLTETPPPPSYLQKIRKQALTHFAPVYLLFVALLASYLQCVAQVPSRDLRIYEGVLFGPLFLFATSRMFGLLSRLYALSVKRDIEGVSYRAISLNDSICKVIVHAALLHVFIATDVRSTKSMRAVVIYAVTNVATLFALTIFLVLHAPQIKFLLSNKVTVDPQEPQYPAWNEFNATTSALLKSSNSSNDNDNFSLLDSLSWNDTTDDSIGYRWPLFALSVLWNIFPVELITLCCRFDYACCSAAAALPLSLAQPQRSDIESSEEAEFVNGNTAIEAGEVDKNWIAEGGQTLTHDMLPVYAPPRERTKSIGGVGPIFLSPEAPDSFYAHLSSPMIASEDTNSNMSKTAKVLKASSTIGQEGTPLPTSLAHSLTHSTSMHPQHQTHLAFPTFISSLLAYLMSTLLFSVLFYLAIEYRSEEALKCLAPLFPLVTLPLTTFAVPLGLLLCSDYRGGFLDLWGYEEVWGSEPQIIDEDGNDTVRRTTSLERSEYGAADDEEKRPLMV